MDEGLDCKVLRKSSKRSPRVSLVIYQYLGQERRNLQMVLK
jgi:hypothetical protein